MITLVLLAAAATQQPLSDKQRVEIAISQRDIRDLERNYLSLRVQYEEQSKKLLERAQELSDRVNKLRNDASEACKKAGMIFDEVKVECTKKPDERSNK